MATMSKYLVQQQFYDSLMLDHIIVVFVVDKDFLFSLPQTSSRSVIGPMKYMMNVFEDDEDDNVKVAHWMTLENSRELQKCVFGY